jgi:hypothetical protein
VFTPWRWEIRRLRPKDKSVIELRYALGSRRCRSRNLAVITLGQPPLLDGVSQALMPVNLHSQYCVWTSERQLRLETWRRLSRLPRPKAIQDERRYRSADQPIPGLRLSLDDVAGCELSKAAMSQVVSCSKQQTTNK